MDKPPIKLQKEIKNEYNRLKENATPFMGSLIGIDIENNKDKTTNIIIITENGSFSGWTVKYDIFELNELERYLFNEIPLYINGILLEKLEIITRPKYEDLKKILDEVYN